MLKTIEVNTEDGVVIVRKLNLRDFGVLLTKLQQLPKEIGKLLEGDDKELTTEKLLEVLPQVTGVAWPELINIIALVTDKDSDFIGSLDLPDSVDVLAAALELNDYKRIVASVKKIMAPKQPHPIPSGK